MTEKNQPGIKMNSGHCLTEDQLDNYICKTLSSKENQRVEQHLNTCDACFRKLVMILSVTFSPTTEAERLELNKIGPKTIDEQVSKILSYDREQNPDQIADSVGNRLWRRVINFINRYFLTATPRWRPALAYIMVILLIAGTWGGYRQLNHLYHLSRAKSLLEQNYRIDSENDLQLTGKFAPGMGQLMAADAFETYQIQIEAHLQKILKNKPEHPEANLLLAKLFIIQKNFIQAESLYIKLQNHGLNSAPLLNDLARMLADKGDTTAALKVLHQAIKVDSLLPEPYYNLGFLLEKIKSNSARNFNKKYIEIEKDTRWLEIISIESY
ncbi:tetratricopeptide repeat protein [candidate division KSB1 bacterium]|nr:tetratricopeptide repeat protein [candidate division KSB1 bacterium]